MYIGFMAKAKKVWRVQDKYGRGPYSGVCEDFLSSGVWRECEHDDTTGRPGPDEDTFSTPVLDLLGRPSIGLKFGFRTKADLKRWFTPRELAKLSELGYKPVKLKAKKVWYGKKQAIFQPVSN